MGKEIPMTKLFDTACYYQNYTVAKCPEGIAAYGAQGMIAIMLGVVVIGLMIMVLGFKRAVLTGEKNGN